MMHKPLSCLMLASTLLMSSFALSNTIASSNLLDLRPLLSNPHLSLAIKDPETGVISYTKNGSFIKKRGHYYQYNARLQGYSMSNSVLADSCTLSDIEAPEGEMSAKASSRVNLTINLDAQDLIHTLPFDNSNPESYNYMVSVIIFDNTGKQHDLKSYFVKTSTDTWTMPIRINNNLVASGNIKFNPSGELIESNGLDHISFKPDPDSETQTIKLNLNATMFPSPYKIKLLNTNGYVSGDLVGDEVDHNGYLSQQYTNGKEIVRGKIAVFAK